MIETWITPGCDWAATIVSAKATRKGRESMKEREKTRRLKGYRKTVNMETGSRLSTFTYQAQCNNALIDIT